MIRILGVISGAAISIAALTWFIGVPQFTSERVQDDSALGVLPVVTAEILPPVAVPVQEPEPDPVAETETATDPAPAEAGIAAVSAQSEPASPDAAPATVFAEPDGDTPTPPSELFSDVAPVSPDLQWFAFWSPFRSEIAANGFVGELQRVTGLDYRVVKVKPGVYEVAFAYAEDDEIDTNLSTISAATGLNLPGTQ